MDREKLIRVVLEGEEELYLEDIRRLQEKDYPDSFFLTELGTIVEDIDWSIGSPASKCFEENEIVRSPEEDYKGSYRDTSREVVRFVNYRGEVKDSVLKTRDKALEFRASDVIIPKDFNDYKPKIKTWGSRVVSNKYEPFSEWMIDSNSDVKIVNLNKTRGLGVDDIVISVIGDNSEVLFSNEVSLELVNIEVTLVLYGENNKVIIDMDNFGIRSGVTLKRMSFAKNNEVVVRHMVPEFVVKTVKNFTDNNNNTLKIEIIHDD
jgi:hypothetical protein